MSIENYELLREQFRKLFERKWDASELDDFAELRERFAFHMTEIDYNLKRLAQTYENPGSCDEPCLQERVEMFFLDCVPHLMAAANIYDEIPQVFPEQQGVHDWESFTDDESTAH